MATKKLKHRRTSSALVKRPKTLKKQSPGAKKQWLLLVKSYTSSLKRRKRMSLVHEKVTTADQQTYNAKLALIEEVISQYEGLIKVCEKKDANLTKAQQELATEKQKNAILSGEVSQLTAELRDERSHSEERLGIRSRRALEDIQKLTVARDRLKQFLAIHDQES